MLFAIPSVAEVPANAEAVKTHLEFMGYEVTQNEKRMKATHSKHLNILLKKYRGGIYVVAFYGGNESAKSDRYGYLNAINQLNEKSVIVRYYADEASDLAIESVYLGDYEKGRFSDFMEKFNNSLEQLKDDTGGIKRYLQ
jgi:hypothetical protein